MSGKFYLIFLEVRERVRAAARLLPESPQCPRRPIIRADAEFRCGPSLERQKDLSKTPRIQHLLPGPFHPSANKKDCRPKNLTKCNSPFLIILI